MSPNHETRQKRSRRQFTLKGLLALPLVVSALFAAYAWLVHPIEKGQRAHDRIEKAILKLATKRPADVSRNRWAFCIEWTWLLHGNFGNSFYYDPDELQLLADELDERADAPVNMATIDWIWDQYEQRAPACQHFSENYRPTIEQHLKQRVDLVTSPADDHLQEWIDRQKTWGSD